MLKRGRWLDFEHVLRGTLVELNCVDEVVQVDVREHNGVEVQLALLD